MSEMENKVRALLVKYYQAETSLEEEDYLREYFCNNQNIPFDLLAEREMFSTHATIIPNVHHNIEAGILNAIDKAKREEKILPFRIGKHAPVWAAAASIVVLLGIAWFLSNNTPESLMVDTYDDPYVALQETQRVLALVGSKINMVQNEMRSLEMLLLPNQMLDPVNGFSKSVQQLEKLKAIEKPKEMPFIKYIFTANSIEQNVEN